MIPVDRCAEDWIVPFSRSNQIWHRVRRKGPNNEAWSWIRRVRGMVKLCLSITWR